MTKINASTNFKNHLLRNHQITDFLKRSFEKGGTD